MPGIPVTIHVDAATFNALELAAAKRGVNVRDMIAAHLRRSLFGEHVPTTHTRLSGAYRSQNSNAIDQWEQAARAGVTNNAIAERWGVSKSLVSKRLRERGIHRQQANRKEQS